MSELSLAEIERLAVLARLSLTDQEKEQFAAQLPKIVEFVDTLQGASLTTATSDQMPISVADLRQDELSGQRLTLAELEKLAPAWRVGQVIVPAVFEGRSK